MLTDGLIGQVVANRYRVDRKIARGGMGAIYEVTHTSLGRKFAMKTLAPDLSDSDEALGRFRREADIVASLRHPNIVEVIDWVEHDGMPAMIMELLKGEDLKTRLRRPRRLSWNFIARVTDPILSALAVAHKAGVVHRDLKPENIFLARDDSGEVRPKLLDFGVSKMWAAEAFQTTGARLIGTPAYMSPEQARGESNIGPAADVWGMAAIMFLMATKKHAFEAPNVPVLLNRITYGDPERVRTYRPGAPPEFEELLLAAMSRDDKRRITDMEELRAGLRSTLASVAPGAFPAPLLDDSNFDSTMPPTVPGLDTPAFVDEDDQPTTLSSGAGQALPLSDMRSHRRTMVIGSVVLAAFAAVVVVALTVPTDNATPSGETAAEAADALDETASAAPGTESAAQPGTEPEPESEPEPEPEPEPAIAAADQALDSPAEPADETAAPDKAATGPAEPAETAMVTIEIMSRPRGATVFFRGKRLGKTPVRHQVPQSDEQVEFELRRNGYKPRTLRVAASSGGSYERALEKKRRRARGSSKPKSTPTLPPPKPDPDAPGKVPDWAK